MNIINLLTPRFIKRLLVLKDALAQVKSGFLVPSHSGVCRIPGLGVFEIGDKDLPNLGAKELLLKLRREENSCRVCARGSLLLTTVARFNKFTQEDLNESQTDEYSSPQSNTDRRLYELFSPDQLALMEIAFESRFGYTLTNEQRRRAVCFYDKYVTPKERLIAILENAVKNWGTFKP